MEQTLGPQPAPTLKTESVMLVNPADTAKPSVAAKDRCANIARNLKFNATMQTANVTEPRSRSSSERA